MQPSNFAIHPVSAIVVAAGLSRRMGTFKLTLPWGRTSVIRAVVETLSLARLAEVLVVTGHREAEIREQLAGASARCIHNPRFETGGMLSSIQTGLTALMEDHDGTLAPPINAALMCLGDQPQMELSTVKAVVEEGERTGWQRVIIPSYRMRAGHPILIPSSFWPQIIDTTESLRVVLRSEQDFVTYLPIESASLLMDLDTPEDYKRATSPYHGE